MFEKIQIKARKWLHELRDVRSVGFLVFGILALLVSWSTVGVIQTNYELQKRVARIERENQIKELENTNARLRNEYLNTDQYLELAARRHFGKAAEGETVYVVPKSTALAYVSPAEEKPTPAQIIEDNRPTYQKNFDAWMRFLFHPTGN